ncbi:uncharacterized protein LOC129052230 [Pongo abelii]|uniref:uncharacterized protein LOC129052230 n=1 Tax=Pongo abelii TaxID=9601 RepID=UPI0023E77FE8|nr:uncharacterized protein LOC129052230 [Pongo abelii]
MLFIYSTFLEEFLSLISKKCRRIREIPEVWSMKITALSVSIDAENCRRGSLATGVFRKFTKTFSVFQQLLYLNPTQFPISSEIRILKDWSHSLNGREENAAGANTNVTTALKVQTARFPLNLSRGLIFWPSANLRKVRQQVCTRSLWDPERSASRERAQTQERQPARSLWLRCSRNTKCLGKPWLCLGSPATISCGKSQVNLKLEPSMP